MKRIDTLMKYNEKYDIAELFVQLEKSHRKQVDKIKELEDELEDWQETHNLIINEECPSDERHCTCVPSLRKEIKELKEKMKPFHKITCNHWNYLGLQKPYPIDLDTECNCGLNEALK